MREDRRFIRGRGAVDNPPNRFERVEYVPDGDNLDVDEERSRPKTVLHDDHSCSIVSRNDSPDISFNASLNPYRGCEHGCTYCYARPTHEYLGYSAGLDFETQILVKRDAARLLREELTSPRWRPETIALSGVTDPYQPAERKLRLTRACLEVLAEFGNPVSVVTKNGLVARDVDHLSALAAKRAAYVCLSITTLDRTISRRLEPRTSMPQRRLAAIKRLTAAGIPVGVLVAPVIPGLTDHEIPAILSAAADAGACFASYLLLRLPHAVAPMFAKWLEVHYPDRRKKVLDRVRHVRGGTLNDARFHARMRGQGVFAEQVDV